MAGDPVVKLLEEIRDLQRENVTNQKIALQNQQVSLTNQQQSMAVQKRAAQRSKITYVFLGVFVLFLSLSYALPIFSWLLCWMVRR